MTDYHLAQLNIARAKGESDDPVMQAFVARIDEINALADQAPGFIWRLQDEEGDAVNIRVFDDPLLLVNMSVWESLQALKDYVYQSMHVELMKNRKEWFNRMEQMHQVMWWVPAGHIPSVQEGKARLEKIRTQGPGPEGFSFAHPFPAA